MVQERRVLTRPCYVSCRLSRWLRRPGQAVPLGDRDAHLASVHLGENHAADARGGDHVGSKATSQRDHQNGVGTAREDYWDGCSRLFGRQGRVIASDRSEHGNLPPDEICVDRAAARSAPPPSGIRGQHCGRLDNPSHSSLDGTPQYRRSPHPRSSTEEPDHRHRRLLRAHSERPFHRRAAEKRDEPSSPHSHPQINQGVNRISHAIRDQRSMNTEGLVTCLVHGPLHPKVHASRHFLDRSAFVERRCAPSRA